METTTPSGALPPYQRDKWGFTIGLTLAIVSSVFIGSSFIIKKLSLLRLNRRAGAVRAGAGGFGYLKDWMWWTGLLSMGIGELANFAAYTFAPAALVTPLGALSVLVSALLAAKFLDETLNAFGKLGCVLCIVGSIIIIIHAPKEQEMESIQELMEKFQNPVFLNYLVVISLISLSIIFFLGPRYGSRHVVVYITLCSAIGSLTVMAAKGFGLSVTNILNSEKSPEEMQLSLILSFGFLLAVVLFVVVQMNYLNKALDLFNTNMVTPVYYVMFTTLVITASAILFREWQKMSMNDVLGSLCGFFVVIVAIYLLQACKRQDTFCQRTLLSRQGSRDYGSHKYSFVQPSV